MPSRPGFRIEWWLVLIAASGFALARAEAQTPPLELAPKPAASAAAAPADPADPAAALQQGLELERKRNWAAAIRAYEKALEAWPSRTDFSHRLSLCEMHYRLARRYGDRSFREVLLKLPHDKAMDVFDELVDRIESHYVEPVALERIVLRGLDNMEVALRDPVFLKANCTTADPARVAWLRQAIRQRRDALEINTRQAARNEILTVCELARQSLDLKPAPVVLEFTFGACDILDPYSSYLTPDKLDDMFSVIDGNFVGLGVELKQDDLGLRIIGVIRGGPAAEGGLKAGDKIIAVGDKSVKGLGLDEASGLLQGSEGTPVTITVLHPSGKSRTLKITRRHVEVPSVAQAKIVEPGLGVGYIQLTGFQKTSTDELDRAIRDLQHDGMRFLVLDLRGNPGGLLNVAVDIADRFVDRGVIVSTKGRAPGQTQTYRARPDLVYTMPMAVLIDRDSASASEILAGALKDLNRATVVGDRRSYGKGSVQSIFELRTINSGLKLTTAQFYSPTSRPYSEQGVQPDILVTTAAKPAADRDDQSDVAAIDHGDPANDPVLARAIAQARQGSLTAR